MIRSRRRLLGVALALAGLCAAGCGSTPTAVTVVSQVTVPSTTLPPTTPAAPTSVAPASSAPPVSTTTTTTARPTTTRPSGSFTLALAGDVNFAERTATLLDDPRTAFRGVGPELARADLAMVNLETAITTGGDQQDKSFTFRAPPSALTALAAGGVDIATMANNHGADYGTSGLDDTLAAIAGTKQPTVIGIGKDATQAYAPWTGTVNGVPVAIFAATAVHDQTLANFTAGDASAGVASAFSDHLTDGVTAQAKAGRTVIVFLHWGTEYTTCPDDDQRMLADELASAGAVAVVGTHAHVLQGAGWRADGKYVAYGLSNYLWWRSFGNEQDDNGVLTLTVTRTAVTAASFAPSHLDDAGIPVPATGATRDRILAEWERDRRCADLAATPPR
jgi:poly-gamma-glutamate capsule biosynthesis protein CapA/YwtB (metallophosphatase superfamily)